MKSIHYIQQEIIQEFSRFNSDMEMTIFHIIRLGQHLPLMPEGYRTDEYLIKGCQSKVWLAAVVKDNKLNFYADSNTAITKGLISLLIRIFDEQPPGQIMKADLYFMQKNKLERFIGTKRSNGFAAMIQQIKQLAGSFAT